MFEKNSAQAIAMRALSLIAEEPRADGSYARDRRACQVLAAQACAELKKLAASSNSSDADAQGQLPVQSDLVPHHLEGKKLVAYSDGACKGNPGPAGWGAILVADGHIAVEKNGYLGVSTNNVGELTGAIEALKMVPAGSTVDLHVDSQYVQKGINEWRHGWVRRNWLTAEGEPVKNRELWQVLLRLVDARKVTVHWVKAHAGQVYNERCDELANAAIRNSRGA